MQSPGELLRAEQGARGPGKAKHSIRRANEVPFGGLFEERLGRARYEGVREGGVKGKRSDQSGQEGMMLARESALEREYDREDQKKREGGGKGTKRKEKREE